MKSVKFWLAILTAVLNGVLLVLELKETGSSNGYFSAMLGWALVAILSTD